MAARVVTFLTISLTGCAVPQVNVTTAPERPGTKPPPNATTKFGEYMPLPGQVVPLHGQELPRTDVASSSGSSFWPDKAKGEPPAELLIQPQSYPPRKPEPAKLSGTVPEPVAVGAMRAYMDGRTDIAAERLKGLDASNQKVMMTMLPAMAQASRAEIERQPAEAAVLVAQLESALDTAAKLAPLKIRKACLVWRVSQFGVYDPVPDNHAFLPGGTGLLYLELQNAPSAATALPAGGSGFVTRLECSWQIAAADGTVIAPPRTMPHAEYSRSALRDYFLRLEFDVPKASGPHSVIVDVRDPATGRKVRQAVEFVVGK